MAGLGHVLLFFLLFWGEGKENQTSCMCVLFLLFQHANERGADGGMEMLHWWFRYVQMFMLLNIHMWIKTQDRRIPYLGMKIHKHQLYSVMSRQGGHGLTF